MIIDKFQILRNIYPQIVSTVDDVAYDANGNEIAYDKVAIEVEISKLQAEEAAKEQAVIDAKKSAMDKLTALGLTADEITALTGN